MHPGASQDLTTILYMYKQHTETQNIHKHIAKLSILIKPINYTYQSNITQIVLFRPQSLSINYYTKYHCHLTQNLRVMKFLISTNDIRYDQCH
jgi:hypothetical protein